MDAPVTNVPEYTVTEISGAVKRTLETTFGRIRVRGEVTELKRVAWPSRREVTTFTLVTLITAGFVMLYAFILDLTLKQGVLNLLELR